MNQDDLNRFLCFVVDKQNECWLWKGASTGHSSDGKGYGYFKLNGKAQRAHRVSFEHFNRPLLPGEDCCHKCNTPLCVNPKHLFAGNESQNIQQAYDQGRRKTSLTKEQVKEIKQRLLAGFTNNNLARIYGVRSSTISAIGHGNLHPNI